MVAKHSKLRFQMHKLIILTSISNLSYEFSLVTTFLFHTKH